MVSSPTSGLQSLLYRFLHLPQRLFTEFGIDTLADVGEDPAAILLIGVQASNSGGIFCQ